MRSLLMLLSTVSLASLLLAGCTETNPTPPDPVDHDIVTTVTIVLRPTGVLIDSLVAVWEDIDGVGGKNPNRIDTLTLSAGVVYSGTIRIENRSVTPAIDITSEVATQKDNHQFFYEITNSLGTVVVLDKDSRNMPVGLQYSVSATTAATAVFGKFKMFLSHFEKATDKNGTTPSTETDVSIELPIVVN
ncbi:MAG: hypothetical protein NTX15_06970 [Candidatus Kapabacteria bacterium]|nr:hypothetical protein [Candidatus Kapabacteria bacterium]